MITRFDSSDERLLVESRYSGGERIMVAIVIAGLCFAGYFFALFALSRVAPDPPDDYRLVGFGIATIVVALLMLPRFRRGWERIELDGTRFVHERFIGPLRRSHDEYDLLRMKGLRASPVIGPALETEWVGLGFWYRSGPRWFGDSLSEHERTQVAEHFMAHDKRIRESLGMDSGAGLADSAFWDSAQAREARLAELYTDQRYI